MLKNYLLNYSQKLLKTLLYVYVALSRTDSGRMNPNDMSETSTTDGYITATDSMSGVTTTAQGISHTTSSFDSVSSHFSLNKADTLEELQQVTHQFFSVSLKFVSRVIQINFPTRFLIRHY